jgi:hypothetical protein
VLISRAEQARPRRVDYATQCPKSHLLLRTLADAPRLCRMCAQHVARDDAVMACNECRHIVCMTCLGALQDSHDRTSCVVSSTDVGAVFPLVGVTLPFLLQFKADWEHIYHNLTTGQTCQLLIRPLTFLSKLSVCDVLLAAGSSEARPRPTWFLSHTWSNRFSDTLDSALHFFQSLPHDDGDVVVWMDVFSVSQVTFQMHPPNLYLIYKPFAVANFRTSTNPLPLQHDISQLSQWWMRTFRDAISSIGNLLMVMQPWNDPVSMKRAWYVLVYLPVFTPRLYGHAAAPLRCPGACNISRVSGACSSFFPAHPPEEDLTSACPPLNNRVSFRR